VQLGLEQRVLGQARLEHGAPGAMLQAAFREALRLAKRLDPLAHLGREVGVSHLQLPELEAGRRLRHGQRNVIARAGRRRGRVRAAADRGGRA
jgi:hypothetical protein